MRFPAARNPLVAAPLLAGSLLVWLCTTAAWGQTEGLDAWSIQTASQSGADGRVRFNWQLDPGATVTDHVNVRNLGSQALTVRVYASDALTTPGGGFDLLPADAPPADVGSWIQLEHDAVALLPGQSQLVPFTVSVPGNATPGDHLGGIVASLSSTAAANAVSGVRVDYRVGVRAYVRVSGTLTPDLTVSDFKLAYTPTLNPIGGGAMDISYTVRNQGNVRLAVLQRARVTGPFGLTVAEAEPVEMPQALPGQSYTAAASVSNVLPALLLTTELMLQPRLPDEAPAMELAAITASADVWAPPWVQLALLTAGALGSIRLRRVIRTHRNRTRAQDGLTTETIKALVERLNAEYRPEILIVCRAAGGQPRATEAQVADVGPDALELIATVDGAFVRTRVLWGQHVSTAVEVERELLRLARRAAPIDPAQEAALEE